MAGEFSPYLVSFSLFICCATSLSTSLILITSSSLFPSPPSCTSPPSASGTPIDPQCKCIFVFQQWLWSPHTFFEFVRSLLYFLESLSTVIEASFLIFKEASRQSSISSSNMYCSWSPIHLNYTGQSLLTPIMMTHLLTSHTSVTFLPSI